MHILCMLQAISLQSPMNRTLRINICNIMDLSCMSSRYSHVSAMRTEPCLPHQERKYSDILSKLISSIGNVSIYSSKPDERLSRFPVSLKGPVSSGNMSSGSAYPYCPIRRQECPVCLMPSRNLPVWNNTYRLSIMRMNIWRIFCLFENLFSIELYSRTLSMSNMSIDIFDMAKI